MIKATWMSNNILTIESLLADSVPTSNYEWADEFPNLSAVAVKPPTLGGGYKATHTL